MLDFNLNILTGLTTALAMGALVGVERELEQRTYEKGAPQDFSSFRRYTVAALLGFLGAMSAQVWGAPMLLLTFGLVGAFALASYWHETQVRQLAGVTASFAALIAFITGAIAAVSPHLAMTLGVVTVVVLALKYPLRRFVSALQPEEFFAAVKFLIIAGVVLPLLPRTAIDPWGILVPYEAWLVVVFVSAISFVGYVLMKLLGPRAGTLLTGLVGGLASSTATTSSMSEQSRGSKLVLPFAMAVILAGGVMFVRVGFEVWVLHRALLGTLAVPLGALLLGTAVVLGALFSWDVRQHEGHGAEPPSILSPFRFVPALKFAAFYVFILFIAKFAQLFLGDAGVLVASAAAGLADVDAITVSLARLARAGEVAPQLAAIGITTAVMVNTLVKLVIVWVFGSPAFRRIVLGATVVVLAAGCAGIAVLW